MRIRAERDDLADVLSRAARGVGARSPQPILQGLLCDVQGNRLHVTGTDLEMTVRTELEVEVLEEGRTVIPARLSSDAVKKLPPGAVVMNVADGEVEIAGGGPKFRFREQKVEDYPNLAEPSMEGAVDVEGAVLAGAVAQVGVAASTDENRPILTGVLFEEHEGSLRLVATDSYRLGVRDLPDVAAPVQGLVPVRGLKELDRTIGAETVTVALADREAAFRSPRGTLTVRLIEGTFPNYRQLLPENYPNRLVVGKEALLEAIDRAALVAEDHIPLRMMMTSGGVEITVTRQDVGGETEMVEGDYTGEDLTIAFNPRYLNDGVGAVKDKEIVIETTDSLKPSLIHGAESEGFRYLLMPVRL